MLWEAATSATSRDIDETLADGLQDLPEKPQGQAVLSTSHCGRRSARGGVDSRRRDQNICSLIAIEISPAQCDSITKCRAFNVRPE
jgi:hypothetical protein